MRNILSSFSLILVLLATACASEPANAKFISAEMDGTLEGGINAVRLEIVDGCLHVATSAESNVFDEQFRAAFPSGTTMQGNVVKISGGDSLEVAEDTDLAGGLLPPTFDGALEIPDECQSDLPMFLISGRL